jgi:hypothetical protein
MEWGRRARLRRFLEEAPTPNSVSNRFGGTKGAARNCANGSQVISASFVSFVKFVGAPSNRSDSGQIIHLSGSTRKSISVARRRAHLSSDYEMASPIFEHPGFLHWIFSSNNPTAENSANWTLRREVPRERVADRPPPVLRISDGTPIGNNPPEKDGFLRPTRLCRISVADTIEQPIKDSHRGPRPACRRRVLIRIAAMQF